jgi:hypothetical protein
MFALRFFYNKSLRSNSSTSRLLSDPSAPLPECYANNPEQLQEEEFRVSVAFQNEEQREANYLRGLIALYGVEKQAKLAMRRMRGDALEDDIFPGGSRLGHV